MPTQVDVRATVRGRSGIPLAIEVSVDGGGNLSRRIEEAVRAMETAVTEHLDGYRAVEPETREEWSRRKLEEMRG